jgi:L-lactate dehydrogenase complex protein LldF
LGARREGSARIILASCARAGAKTVTKGKSMVSEEIALNPHLEANGIVPVETDLGEYIIQLRTSRPATSSRPPSISTRKTWPNPSAKRTRRSIPRVRSDERTALVAEARRMLRAQFEAADAGITGANFLAAEEGAAVIVTNEGNGDLTRLLAAHAYRSDRHREDRRPI